MTKETYSVQGRCGNCRREQAITKPLGTALPERGLFRRSGGGATCDKCGCPEVYPAWA